jgi:molybdate-binding protein
LRREGLTVESLRRAHVAPTGPDIAQGVRAGHADFGVATRAVATAAGLDFVPLCVERFDLLMRQRDYFRPPLQALFALFSETRFLARARELGGLDVSGAGRVRWAP